MNAYQIAEVRYQNFGPFEDATLDFSQPGLTVIDGHIDGFFGCDSNGAGKSFLFDGVAWALFGRCLRERYTGDDIRRHVWIDGTQRNAVPEGQWTCVTVTLVGDDTLSVARYRKHPVYKDQVRLTIGGVDRSRGTTPQTTDAIVSAIGMDFNTFCNSVAFAAREDIKSFLSEGASDGDRKKVLEKILGLELYGVAAGVARARLRTCIAELDGCTQARDRLDAALSEKRALLDDLRTPEDTADLTLRIAHARVSVRQLDRHIGAVTAKAEQIKAELQEATAAHAKVRKAYQTVKADYLVKRDACVEQAAGADRRASRLRGQKEPYEAQIAEIRKLKGKACPTCQKTLTPAQTQKLVAEAEDFLEGLEREAATFDSVSAGADAALTQLGAPPERPPEQSIEMDTLTQEDRVLYQRYRDLDARRRQEDATLREMLGQQAQATGQRTKLRKEIRAVEADVQARDVEIATQRTTAEMLEFWVEGFGNQGLKSFLIEAETPRINKTATRLARRLLGEGTRLRISATRQLKTTQAMKEQLSIEAVIPGCTNTYAGASRAQKKRLDLALILAFREVVAGRAVKGFRQLFADEIFDGMDASGVEAAGDLLRDLSTECPVAVISHQPEVKALADRLVVVTHTDGQATVANAGCSGERGLRAGPTTAYDPKRKKSRRIGAPPSSKKQESQSRGKRQRQGRKV